MRASKGSSKSSSWAPGIRGVAPATCGPDLSACIALRDHVRDLLVAIKATGEWQMSPGAVPNIGYGTVARGTTTYRAALLLADRGYGEQAGMLNRSLFEHPVVAWWLLLQQEQEAVMERIRAHREHAQVLYDRHAALHPELALDDEPEDENAPNIGDARELAYDNCREVIRVKVNGHWSAKRKKAVGAGGIRTRGPAARTLVFKARPREWLPMAGAMPADTRSVSDGLRGFPTGNRVSYRWQGAPQRGCWDLVG